MACKCDSEPKESMYHIAMVEIMNKVALGALVCGPKSLALKQRIAEHRETLIGEMALFQRGKTCFTCIKEEIEQTQPQLCGT
jgi:hypothetical protein